MRRYSPYQLNDGKPYENRFEVGNTIEMSAHVYFNQIKAVHVKEWYIMIRGTRQDYRITFDVNGNFMAMK